MTVRRTCQNIFTCVSRHRPSGVVSLFMIFFIAAYVLIVKYDSDARVINTDEAIKTNSSAAAVAAVTAAKVIRTHVNIIPKDILADFAKEEELKHRVNINKTDKPKIEKIVKRKQITARPIMQPAESIEIVEPSDNELLLSNALQEDELNIDHQWNSYLDKDKNDIIGNNAKQKPLKPNKYMRFQGVQIQKLKTLPRRPKTIPKAIQIFEALKESKQLRNSITSNKCILLKTLHGDAPICIHDPEYDELISARIVEKGTWEPNYLYITGMIIKLNPELMFLDLGCNIGVYTILAAKLGATVISVDPNKANLRLLTKSVSLSDRRNMVTLMWNAVSNIHENVSLNEIIGNVGGTFVSSFEENSEEKADESNQAITITLDDLITFFERKPVFIKMDIETYEWKALQGGRKFFKEVDVKYVLMEWIYHREAETGEDIINYMTSFGLYAHVNAHHNTKLETDNYQSWPDNVLWIKY